ncbi:MAG: dipeptidase [Bacteroidia bacterium]|nr:dipeptidase [Bacteroidia bacterium]
MFVSCQHEPGLGYATSLAHRLIITDGHVDLPYRMKVSNFRLKRAYLDVSVRTADGDFDYVRARAGGLDAPFMSIYIPSDNQLTPGLSKRVADSLIDMVLAIPARYPAHYMMAYTPDDVLEAARTGKIALPMGMENGAPIEDDIRNVAYFYERGIRYITLTHATDNRICDSSYDTTRTWNGLSPFGAQVVREMNRLGIMVDISHVSDSSFYEVLQIVKAPVIASHSSCRYFTPGFERNMNDDMLKALARNGGVIQINFGSTFLDSLSRQKFEVFRKEVSTYAADHNLAEGDSAYQAFIQQYYREKGYPHSDVARVADHIDHVVAIAGIDHVGLGSDYDGVGDSLPQGLKDVSDYPNLILELLRRGYSEADIAKICYQNVFRVWRAVAAAAGS